MHGGGGEGTPVAAMHAWAGGRMHGLEGCRLRGADHQTRDNTHIYEHNSGVCIFPYNVRELYAHARTRF